MIEPIALYHRPDLNDEEDSARLAADPGGVAGFARARVYRPESSDLTLVSYGNGVAMSLRAAEHRRKSKGSSEDEIVAAALDLCRAKR